jgi:hypothetical protein
MWTDHPHARCASVHFVRLPRSFRERPPGEDAPGQVYLILVLLLCGFVFVASSAAAVSIDTSVPGRIVGLLFAVGSAAKGVRVFGEWRLGHRRRA